MGGGDQQYGLSYYMKSGFAGGVCCSITHSAMCPVDVVKTRMQLEPQIYNKGMIAGFRQVIAAEGAGALATGLGATAVGYFIQVGILGATAVGYFIQVGVCFRGFF